ncbi:MAG TPA: NADH-quinone oxidoreductase subunit C [bacterium]|nr:NADH-quinone oxidoreductase subunit C [bacterium]
MTPDRVAALLQRFPTLRDLVAEMRAAATKADEAWAAKEREWQAAAEQAKAEGKPAPRPLRREDPPVYRYHAASFEASRQEIVDVCRWLRDNPEFDMAVLEYVSAVDLPDRFDVVYHLVSLTRSHNVTLKVPVPKGDAHLPSVVGIWRGADWHERETYDLFGIAFDGHPDLRRIMMSEDWKGHPLRKDYVYEDPEWLRDVAAERQREIAATSNGDDHGARS